MLKKLFKVLALIIVIIISAASVFLVYINVEYAHINPEIRVMGVISDLFVSFDDFDSLKSLSENTPSMPTTLDENVITEEIFINDGNLRVLIMRHSDQEDISNAVLWFHGGGYALKEPKDELAMMQNFVLHNQAVVISPDYTLSVESPYPAALNDAYEALLWIKNNAEKLNIDEDKIFVGGGSAGGGLSVALSLYARDKEEVDIAFLMPLYPMINHKTIPNNEEDDYLVWDLKRNEIAWDAYLNGSDEVSIYASPLLNDDFSNLPPTYTFVGTEDPFYKDTLTYVEKLKEDHVEVHFDVYEGAYHGFDVVSPTANLSKEAWKELLKYYDLALMD